MFEQPVAVQRLWVERGPEIHSLPDLDSLLELRLLELHPNPVLDLIHVAERIETQDRNGPRSGRRTPSTHSIVVVLPAPFGPINPKTSPSLTSNETSETAAVAP